MGENELFSLVKEVGFECLLGCLLGKKTAGVMLSRLSGNLQKREIQLGLTEPPLGFLLKILHKGPSHTRGYGGKRGELGA